MLACVGLRREIRSMLPREVERRACCGPAVSLPSSYGESSTTTTDCFGQEEPTLSPFKVKFVGRIKEPTFSYWLIFIKIPSSLFHPQTFYTTLLFMISHFFLSLSVADFQALVRNCAPVAMRLSGSFH